MAGLPRGPNPRYLRTCPPGMACCVAGAQRECFEPQVLDTMPFDANDRAQAECEDGWWSSTVRCAKVEEVHAPGLDNKSRRYFQFCPEDGTGAQWVRMTQISLSRPPDDVCAEHLGRPIRSLTEVRYPHWRGERDSCATGMRDAYVVVDISPMFILLERIGETLEVMLGFGESCLHFMRAHSRSGPRDEPQGLDCRSHRLPSGRNVRDLLEWMDGPLQWTWSPDHAPFHQSHYLATKLKAFLLADVAARPGAPRHHNALQKASFHAPECHKVPADDDGAALSTAPASSKASDNIEDGSLLWAHDRMRALRAVTSDGLSLQHVFLAHRGDQEVVLAAVASNPDAMRFASEALRKDRRFALSAVEVDGLVLRHLGQRLTFDPDVVLAAVRQNEGALAFAAPALRFAKHFAMLAVQVNGLALRYLPAELREDPSIVMAAVRQARRGMVVRF
mmetsp:Transcript_38535/g.110626  ORF Transcript_38535/g.110626 Transcript_38535/m.110626 type:complete len:448 (-) Transcript_38535:162-1505(-)